MVAEADVDDRIRFTVDHDRRRLFDHIPRRRRRRQVRRRLHRLDHARMNAVLLQPDDVVARKTVHRPRRADLVQDDVVRRPVPRHVDHVFLAQHLSLRILTDRHLLFVIIHRGPGQAARRGAGRRADQGAGAGMVRRGADRDRRPPRPVRRLPGAVPVVVWQPVGQQPVAPGSPPSHALPLHHDACGL